jgi:putative membrane protein
MGEEGRTPDPVPSRDWRGDMALVDARIELAAVRTGLALERTRLSADRTLMAVMRTALGLIGLGAAIFEYFYSSSGSTNLSSIPIKSAQNVGAALVLLGLGVLGPGILSHGVFLRRLRQQRAQLAARGLVPPRLDLPGSLANVLAVALFVIGLLAIVRMAYWLGWMG